jgi:hypothetical protein
LAESKWELLKTSREQYGHPRLTFRLFNDHFPTFPIALGTSRLKGVKLHEDPRSSLPEWFNNFERTPFFKAYEEFVEQVAGVANGRAIGLVFPRNRVRGALIIHDGGLEDGWDRGNVFAHTGGTREKPFRVFVQPFAGLIDAIYDRGRGWKPGE